MTTIASQYDIEILESFSDEEVAQEFIDRGLRTGIRNFDSSELKSELEKRNYHVFDYDPTGEDVNLDDVGLSDMVEHIERCGYIVLEKSEMVDHLSGLPPYELKDLLCDIVGVNHHTPKEELLKLISEKL